MDTQKRLGCRRQAEIEVLSWVIAAGLAGAVVWLALSGCVSAPTKTEKLLFDIKTNQVEQVTAITNVLAIDDVAGTTTEVAQVSGFTYLSLGSETAPGHPVRYITNVSYRTNTADAYEYLPSQRATGLATSLSQLGVLGPFGELGAVLLVGALGLWARWRTARSAKLAGVLVQVIETGRAVLQSTPQGQELDDKWKTWMIQHQAEQKVIQDVTELVGTAVDSATAREAAAKLLGLMRDRSAQP